MKDISLNRLSQLEAFFSFVEEFGESEIKPSTKEKLRKTFQELKIEKESEQHEIDKPNHR